MRILIVVALLIGLDSRASADAGDDLSPAEVLYEQGNDAYTSADYARAIVTWQASYDLSRESGLLFNLAQAKRLSGDCAGALATYRRYVAGDPTADDEQHTLARELIHELDGTCVETPAPSAEVSKRVEVPRRAEAPKANDLEARSSRARQTLRIAGLATSGTGLVAIATGFYFGHRAQDLGDQVTAACRTSCDWAMWKAKDAAGRRATTIGRTLDIAGAVGIVGGAVLYYVGVREGTLTVIPRSSERGAVVSWSRSW